MANSKKSIIVYADWIEKFEELTDEEAGKLIKHFFRFVNDLNPTAPDRTTKLMFIDIESSLKRDLNKWENIKEKRSDAGKRGGIKSGETRKVKQNEAKVNSASKVKQTLTNEAVSVSVSVSDSVSVTYLEEEELREPEKFENKIFEEKKEAAAENSVYEPLDFPEEDYLTAWTALTKERFFELIQMQHEKDVEKIKIYFKTFYQEKWADKSLSNYPSRLDFFKNFYRWIPYRKSIDKNQSQTPQIAKNGITNLNNRQFASKTSTADRNRAERDQLDAITNSILLRTEIN